MNLYFAYYFYQQYEPITIHGLCATEHKSRRTNPSSNMARSIRHFLLRFALIIATILLFFILSIHRQKFKVVFTNVSHQVAKRISRYDTKEHHIVFGGSENTVKKDEKSVQTILILFWSTFFGDQVVCDKPISKSKLCNNSDVRLCPTPNCEITANRSRVVDADVIIIHARDPYPLPPAINYSHIPLVLFTWENPVYTPVLSNAEYLSKFTYLMSYRPDVADFYLPSLDPLDVEPQPIPFENKTGLIAAAFSNCETGRTAYLKELMKHIQVDSYGKCLRNKEGLKARYQGNNFKEAKLNMFRNYKFAIVFLNQDCDYFVDSQLTHALNAGTVPVFMGTDKVDKLLGGNLKYSIIKVRDFKSPKKLAEYLMLVSENKALYNKYLTWKYEGFQFEKPFLSTPQGKGMMFRVHPNYCEMCATIAASRQSGKFKKKGSVKAEYCNARKVEDWLP